MKNSENQFVNSHREVMKPIAAGSTVGLFGLFGSSFTRAEFGIATATEKKYPVGTRSDLQVRENDGTIITP